MNDDPCASTHIEYAIVETTVFDMVIEAPLVAVNPEFQKMLGLGAPTDELTVESFTIQ